MGSPTQSSNQHSFTPVLLIFLPQSSDSHLTFTFIIFILKTGSEVEIVSSIRVGLSGSEGDQIAQEERLKRIKTVE